MDKTSQLVPQIKVVNKLLNAQGVLGGSGYGVINTADNDVPNYSGLRSHKAKWLWGMEQLRMQKFIFTIQLEFEKCTAVKKIILEFLGIYLLT